jgi:glycosyltransferase involved in cell wall biosynthesis
MARCSAEKHACDCLDRCIAREGLRRPSLRVRAMPIHTPMLTIALAMIAKDESRCIERCLSSARPWVDEMVVLDTGSTDDTVLIARRCGARIGHFTWCDDFAAARNATLAMTSADWCLVLDADEWIVDGAQALAELRGEPANFIGQISVVSRFDAGAAEVHEAPSWLPRLLPRSVRYTGCVHEQPLTSLPRRRIPLVVAHDGYLRAQMQSKQGRNQRLLELALVTRPDDAYLRYQLGKEFEVRGQFDGAAPHYQCAYSLVEAQASWRHDLVLRLLFTLKKLRRFEPALALAETEMPHWQHSPDFFFTLGDLFLDWAAEQPVRAGELLPMIESSWLQALAIGEAPDLPDSVRGRGSFLAAHNLSVLHQSLGRSCEAREWQERSAQLRQAAN